MVDAELGHDADAFAFLGVPLLGDFAGVGGGAAVDARGLAVPVGRLGDSADDDQHRADGVAVFFQRLNGLGGLGKAFGNLPGTGNGIVDGALAGLMSRAVVIVDESGKVVYTEQVPEIAQEPNYEAALKALG